MKRDMKFQSKFQVISVLLNSTNKSRTTEIKLFSTALAYSFIDRVFKRICKDHFLIWLKPLIYYKWTTYAIFITWLPMLPEIYKEEVVLKVTTKYYVEKNAYATKFKWKNYAYFLGSGYSSKNRMYRYEVESEPVFSFKGRFIWSYNK